MTDPEKLDTSAWPKAVRPEKRPEFAEPSVDPSRVTAFPAAGPTVRPYPSRPAIGPETMAELRGDLFRAAERYTSLTGVPCHPVFGLDAEGRAPTEPAGRGGVRVALAVVAAAGILWLVCGFALFWPAPVDDGYSWGLLGLVALFVVLTVWDAPK